MLDVVRIPALTDNYIWLVHESASGETLVVDPAEAGPVLAEADARGWRITQIWNTHWHPDHTGGNAGIKAATDCAITGPAAEAARIPTLDRMVREGDRVRLGEIEAEVIEVPAHTAGHIAYHFASERVAFVGDTLFAMGCGRLFEGDAEQMFANMQRLAALPDDTQIYCAHEYTLSNGRYALAVEPDNRPHHHRPRARDQPLHARARRGSACGKARCQRYFSGLDALMSQSKRTSHAQDRHPRHGSGMRRHRRHRRDQPDRRPCHRTRPEADGCLAPRQAGWAATLVHPSRADPRHALCRGAHDPL
jgi:hydroxyacylglutathione hydrolase